MTTTTTTAEYTTKDLILYALGIGCSSSPSVEVSPATTSCDYEASALLGDVEGGHRDEHSSSVELKYLYEHHPHFQAFPLYPLALAFNGTKTGDGTDAGDDYGIGDVRRDFSPLRGVQPFPPEGMSIGSLPGRFLRSGNDEVEDEEGGLDPYPVIHVSQAIDIISPLPAPMQVSAVEDRSVSDRGRGADRYDPPVRVQMITRVVRVVPKKVGTFLTTRTEFRLASGGGTNTTGSKLGDFGSPPHSSPPLLCVSEATTLIRGLPRDRVIPFESEISTIVKGTKQPPSVAPDAVVSMQTSPDQAVLYRLSGDYNPIHVDADVAAAAGFSSSSLSTADGTGPSESEVGGTGRVPMPILHGLCTLGFAVRAALLHWAKNRVAEDASSLRVTHVSAQFSLPVAVGASLRVFLWERRKGEDIKPVDNGASSLRHDLRLKLALIFQVHDEARRLVVDGGLVEAVVNPLSQITATSKL